jgi:hypothetical protein
MVLSVKIALFFYYFLAYITDSFYLCTQEREHIAHSRGIIMLRGGLIRLAVFSPFIRYFSGFFVPLWPN